jgi:AcrR family transcriptional regulator
MSNLPPYSLLDLRVQKTIDLLFRAFKDLLIEKHFSKITIQEITKKAKVNRATFYNHFENYSEFIIFCSREGLRRELANNFPFESFTYTAENLRILIDFILEFINTTYNQWNYQWDEILFEKATRIELYYFLSTWIKFPKKTENEIVFSDTDALALSSSITGVGMVWCHSGCLECKEDLVNRTVNLFTNGLPNLQ